MTFQPSNQDPKFSKFPSQFRLNCRNLFQNQSKNRRIMMIKSIRSQSRFPFHLLRSFPQSRTPSYQSSHLLQPFLSSRTRSYQLNLHRIFQQHVTNQNKALNLQNHLKNKIRQMRSLYPIALAKIQIRQQLTRLINPKKFKSRYQLWIQ